MKKLPMILAVVASLALTGAGVATATQEEQYDREGRAAPPGQARQDICHGTGSATNPFVLITVPVNSNHFTDHLPEGRDVLPVNGECPGGEPTEMTEPTEVTEPTEMTEPTDDEPEEPNQPDRPDKPEQPPVISEDPPTVTFRPPNRPEITVTINTVLNDLVIFTLDRERFSVPRTDLDDNGTIEPFEDHAMVAAGATKSVETVDLATAATPIQAERAVAAATVLPDTGGPAILLPALMLLAGSSILAYAVLRRR